MSCTVQLFSLYGKPAAELRNVGSFVTALHCYLAIRLSSQTQVCEINSFIQLRGVFSQHNERKERKKRNATNVRNVRCVRCVRCVWMETPLQAHILRPDVGIKKTVIQIFMLYLFQACDVLYSVCFAGFSLIFYGVSC